jgi:hypothetical protein
MICLQYVIGPGYRAQRWLPPDELLSVFFFGGSGLYLRRSGSAITKGRDLQDSCLATRNPPWTQPGLCQVLYPRVKELPWGIYTRPFREHFLLIMTFHLGPIVLDATIRRPL